jgi:hypothetical protein
MTQKERVLAMLKHGPVCGTQFLKAFIPRYAVHIHKLRQEGYSIGKRQCSQYHEAHIDYLRGITYCGHDTVQWRYTLEE